MNCCICGTVRNCESYLNNVFKNIEKIGGLFDDYEILIYYDKSTDNTLGILKQYQQINPKLFIHINKDILSEYRTVRIANGRNICLDYIRKNSDKFPYFIMIDFDEVNAGNIDIEPIKKNLKRYDWDAISFNKKFYYDIWALSIKPYYLSCAHIGKEAGEKMLAYITNLLNNTKKNDLLPCASAFCGFSIYRSKKFLDCYYLGLLNLDLFPAKVIKNNISIFGNKFNYKKKDDCEHRNFHLMAINKNQARIRISPEIVFNDK